ncbi:MAG: DUF359 domain-containing protein [Candidatus Thorarchaeota archaeon]|nr:DUF359 domain-containing protein [Candidatus Thorarchaeota archaeon]
MTKTYALNLFDRLHVGHQVLIDYIQDADRPIAVVTDGELMGHDLELGQIIQPVEVRVKALQKYLELNDLEGIIEITVFDRYEDLLKIEGATTFVMFKGPCCTEIDEKGVHQRKEVFGDIDKHKYIKPVRADDGDKVSSARIRLGQIDREGRRLVGTEEPPRRLEMERRGDLKSPKGDLFDVRDGPPEEQAVKRLEDETPKQVITVGDVTSATLIEAGAKPDLCIVDGSTKRGIYDKTITLQREYRIYNPAAAIYPEAWSTIGTALRDRHQSLIFVEGEEDLLGFPVVLLAPEGSVMLYGQPDKGIVWVPVTEENKSRARALLDQMPVIT